MFQYRFKQVWLELNTTRGAGETPPGLSQAASPGAASEAELSAPGHRAAAASPWGRAQPRRLCGAATAETLWEGHREFPHTPGETDNSSQGWLKICRLQTVFKAPVWKAVPKRRASAALGGSGSGSCASCAPVRAQLRAGTNCGWSRTVPNSAGFSRCGPSSTGD